MYKSSNSVEKMRILEIILLSENEAIYRNYNDLLQTELQLIDKKDILFSAALLDLLSSVIWSD